MDLRRLREEQARAVSRSPASGRGGARADAPSWNRRRRRASRPSRGATRLSAHWSARRDGRVAAGFRRWRGMAVAATAARAGAGASRAFRRRRALPPGRRGVRERGRVGRRRDGGRRRGRGSVPRVATEGVRVRSVARMGRVRRARCRGGEGDGGGAAKERGGDDARRTRRRGIERRRDGGGGGGEAEAAKVHAAGVRPAREGAGGELGNLGFRRRRVRGARTRTEGLRRFAEYLFKGAAGVASRTRHPRSARRRRGRVFYHVI